MEKILDIYIDTALAGYLSYENEEYRFQYDDSYIATQTGTPVSLSMPISREIYGTEVARTFFRNLLPEGFLRERLERNFRIEKDNDFELLQVVGADCVGAIGALRHGEKFNADYEYDYFGETDLAARIKTAREQPFLVDGKKYRLSLPGTQDKMTLFYRDGAFALPKDNAPSTHILKPPAIKIEGRPFARHLPENEAFVMELARRCGLPAPPSELIPVGKEYAFLTARYDREMGHDGRVRRLHQEDFCQINKLDSDLKYESDGKMGLPSCFRTIDRYSYTPIEDTENIFRWATFNALVGNEDAHLKNISLLERGAENRLAPFYDLVSTIIYPNLTREMAMKIGNANRIFMVQPRHFEQMLEETGLAFRQKEMHRIVEDMTQRVAELIDPVRAEFIDRYGPCSIYDDISRAVNRSTRKLLSSYRSSQGMTR